MTKLEDLIVEITKWEDSHTAESYEALLVKAQVLAKIAAGHSHLLKNLAAGRSDSGSSLRARAGVMLNEADRIVERAASV